MSVSRVKLVLIAVLAATVVGCSAMLARLGGSHPACVATYVALTDSTAIGADGCGNSWLRQGHRCFLLADSLSGVIEIRCPSEGDTLAVSK